MPKILIYRYLTFFFYAGDIKERGHVHVVNNKSFLFEAKIWFEGSVELFEQGNLSDKEIALAINLVKQNTVFLQHQWNLFRTGKKTTIKTITKL